MELKGRRSVSPALHSYGPEESLEELNELARSAGARVVERILQRREARDAATLIGAGKVRELAALAQSSPAELVIFDQDLTPTQQRNLENALAVKVIDRTQLILDIFAARARTREGRLQVELAQLNYLLPRLAGRGAQMSRLGGGIGTRGPGETQLETDRRRIARRIRKIEEALEGVRAGRALHRRKRRSVPLATAALVGYTNAGKSTLFNRLTEAGVLADARLFATLDPTVRALVLPSRRRILLSDTVGFIRSLPTTLVEAFRATLEEVAEASLVLHVSDAASPHAAAQSAHVLEVLKEIGAGGLPQLLVLNKMDLWGGQDGETVSRRLLAAAGAAADVRAVAISAKTGQGVDRFLELIDQMLPLDPVVRARFRFPLADAGKLASLHDFGRVLETRYLDECCEIEAEVPTSLKDQLVAFVLPER